MQITTRLVATKVHESVVTLDDLKGVAIAAAKKQLGLADASVISADATVAADGSITVEVVESVPPETVTLVPAPAPEATSTAAPMPAPAPILSLVGLAAPAAA